MKSYKKALDFFVARATFKLLATAFTRNA